MDAPCILQGRTIWPEDVLAIERLRAAEPGLSRYQLSRRLCALWDWRDPKGQLHDMAARTLLLKLAARGWITLPPKRWASPNRMRCKQVSWVAHDTAPIHGPLTTLLPLQVQEVSQRPAQRRLFECLLHRYHYLSHTSSVGLNLQYLVETSVDTSRFTGACYRAANWIDLGQTTGRTRQDRYQQLQVPAKQVLVYPLNPDFRGVLCA